MDQLRAADGQLEAQPRSFEPPSAALDAERLLRLALPAEATHDRPPTDTLSDDEGAVGTRLLLTDSHVRVWEFRLEPGESCPFHVHSLPYCFTNLTSNLTQALDECGRCVGEPAWQTQGQTRYVPSESLGAHAVQNVGTGTFLQFIVEFHRKVAQR